MNISICITTFNEEGTIGPLLDSLLAQTKKPDEIVVVDGGSKDRTIEIIHHYQKRFGKIKLLKEKCSRAKGRNLGIEIAKNGIVAITDAGCIARDDWLAEITKPFIHDEVDISAGFYKMTGENSMQKAMGVFLGVTSRKFGINFLPSARSMAFRKSAWEEVGGFPESRENSAEDTDFNYKALKIGLKYARVKSAIVEWGMPETLQEFFNKIRAYAKWDIRYGIWWHPSKGLASHNIKALSILFRYLALVPLFIISLKFSYLFPIWILLFFVYLTWSFRKVFIEFGEYKEAIWGPVLQISSDFAVMSGFISGILGL
jgi:glycosyltransferase involved in cell wall biosynthesis